MQKTDSFFLLPGTVLHMKYRINSVIGQGGFGITYDGTDLKLDMHVAIKEYFPHSMADRENTVSLDVTCTSGTRDLYEKGMKNFLTEAKNMARYAGEENFVAVHDYFAENNTAYIVMEFIEGQNLKQYLKNYGRLTMNQAMPIIMPVMNTLEKIHEQHMIHRDISPSNIMILPDGRVRLLDFGAAKEISMETVDMSAMSAVFKRGYSPIEQLTYGMKQGPYTDIYALCATIYEMLTLCTPPSPLQRAHEGEVLIPPSQLGAKISPVQEAALLKGLEINGADRIQSIWELRAAFCEGDFGYDRYGSFYLYWLLWSSPPGIYTSLVVIPPPGTSAGLSVSLPPRAYTCHLVDINGPPIQEKGTGGMIRMIILPQTRYRMLTTIIADTPMDSMMPKTMALEVILQSRISVLGREDIWQ